jgi:hypothetical protein
MQVSQGLVKHVVHSQKCSARPQGAANVSLSRHWPSVPLRAMRGTARDELHFSFVSLRHCESRVEVLGSASAVVLVAYTRRATHKRKALRRAFRCTIKCRSTDVFKRRLRATASPLA